MPPTSPGTGERGFEIAGIAGSSVGALVGAVWAAGKLAKFEGWARNLTRADVFRMLDVSLRAPGAMRAEKVLAHVQELVGDELIENLEAPFTAVATDLISRRGVRLQRGRLDIAIRASIALPGIFTPMMLNGRLLADGGLLDPIPVSPTAALDPELVDFEPVRRPGVILDDGWPTRGPADGDQSRRQAPGQGGVPARR